MWFDGNSIAAILWRRLEPWSELRAVQAGLLVIATSIGLATSSNASLAAQCDARDSISDHLRAGAIAQNIGEAASREFVDHYMDFIVYALIKVINNKEKCKMQVNIKRKRQKYVMPYRVNEKYLPPEIVIELKINPSEICLGINNSFATSGFRNDDRFPYHISKYHFRGLSVDQPWYKLKCYTWSGVHNGRYIHY